MAIHFFPGHRRTRIMIPGNPLRKPHPFFKIRRVFRFHTESGQEIKKNQPVSLCHVIYPDPSRLPGVLM